MLAGPQWDAADERERGLLDIDETGEVHAMRLSNILADVDVATTMGQSTQSLLDTLNVDNDVPEEGSAVQDPLSPKPSMPSALSRPASLSMSKRATSNMNEIPETRGHLRYQDGPLRDEVQHGIGISNDGDGVSLLALNEALPQTIGQGRDSNNDRPGAQHITLTVDQSLEEDEEIIERQQDSAENDSAFEFEAISLPGARSVTTTNNEETDTTTNISWSLCQTRSAAASSRSSIASSIATWDAFDSIANDDPSLWSISYVQLLALHQEAKHFYGDTFSNSTMRDICKDIIEPLCKRHGKSYALYSNPGGLRVEAFITHSWDEPFGDFVESIHKVFQTSVKRPNLWICAFALIQGVSDDFMQEQLGIDGQFGIEASPFVLALRASKKFVVVRNSVTDLYSRIWCVCELIFANKFGLVPDNTYVTGPDDFSDSRTSCVEAQATDIDDKVRILKVLLADHDYKEIDDFVNQFRAQDSPN